MDADDACAVRRRIMGLLDGARSDGMPADVAQFVTNMMGNYVFHTKSLQELAKLTVWKAVHRRMTELTKVHMPRRLLAGISDLFNLDIE